jgi:hypothetical protein
LIDSVQGFLVLVLRLIAYSLSLNPKIRVANANEPIFARKKGH